MRRDRGYRTYGPYYQKDRDQWRIILVAGDGSRAVEHYPTEADALGRLQDVRAAAATDVLIDEALERFKEHIADTGIKEVTVYTTMRRLKTLVGPHADVVRRLTPSKAQKLYDRMRRDGYSVDYHRNSLSAAKRFGAWLVDERLAKRNPFAEVDGVGKRRRGKDQLTTDESRQFYGFCLARLPDERALAAMVALVFGPRASEVIGIQARHLDDDGRLLRIFGSKTSGAVRPVAIPDEMRQHLLDRAEDLEPADLLFERSRYWLHYWVTKLCRLAGVPRVCPQGLRGTHATLATEAGATGDLVMRQLGHTSTEVARRHYTAGGTAEAAQARVALRVLSGGRR